MQTGVTAQQSRENIVSRCRPAVKPSYWNSHQEFKTNYYKYFKEFMKGEYNG